MEKSSKKSLPIPLVSPRGLSGKTLNCGGEAWVGLRGDFEGGVPLVIESSFWGELLESLRTHISSISPHPGKIILPSKSSFERGVKLGNSDTPSSTSGEGGRTVYLLGTSILRDVGEPLSPLLSRKGVILSNMARGGDFFSRGLPEYYPQSDDTQDTLILHFFRNSAFKYGNFTLQWETGIFFILRYWMMKMSMG